LQQLEVVATFVHQQEQHKKVQQRLLLLLHMETDNKKLTGEANFVLSQKTNKQTVLVKLQQHATNLAKVTMFVSLHELSNKSARVGEKRKENKTKTQVIIILLLYKKFK
jgi:hypothetical protein